MQMPKQLTQVDGMMTDQLPTSDRGLMYGDGLFETMRLQAGQYSHLEQHLQRLLAGCRQLSITVSPETIESQLQSFLSELQHQALDNAVIKLIITRGSGGRGYQPPADAKPRIILQSHPLPARLSHYQQHGITCITARQTVASPAVLPGVKHLNRLEQVLASIELQQASQRHEDTQEALMVDTAGRLLEGTRSNVFLANEDSLFTPSIAEAGIAGIMRQLVLTLAEQRGWSLVVGQLPVTQIQGFQEMFVCNSIIGIWPVNCVSVGGQEILFPQHRFAREIQQVLA
ncbi:aminodeoxychorismate lyase [Pseudohongiella sp. SYSU M77423]|uniref:aminodeoxychorismate lyase n=1 Tax=Pseudohongiella sp. SYSU M77423 TaxID=3042312 RepID=UPI002480E5CB|nr:aminodeoxychorismate lyase [Pseudohongiella sp. SYSU M77423]MDH7943143.1 aminodeoxychorismate lyase [Pseudohongiella sp. SYSU M77423]